MHRIKVDENKPEDEFEQWLFDDEAEIKNLPRYIAPKDPRYNYYGSSNKRFMFMRDLQRPRTSEEKSKTIREARKGPRFQEEGLVDPYDIAKQIAFENWDPGPGKYYTFDAWAGRERAPAHLVLTEGEKSILASTTPKPGDEDPKGKPTMGRGKQKLSPLKKSPSRVCMQRPRDNVGGTDRITSRVLPRAPQPILKTVSRFGGEPDPYGIGTIDLWDNDSVPALGENSTSRFSTKAKGLSRSSSSRTLKRANSLASKTFQDLKELSNRSITSEANEESGLFRSQKSLRDMKRTIQGEVEWEVNDLLELHSIDHHLNGKWRRARLVALKNGGTVDVTYQVRGMEWYRFRVLMAHIRKPPQHPHMFEMIKTDGHTVEESKENESKRLHRADAAVGKEFHIVEDLERLILKVIPPTLVTDRIIADDFAISECLEGWVKCALARDNKIQARLKALEINVPDRLKGQTSVLYRIAGRSKRVQLKMVQFLDFKDMLSVARFLSYREILQMTATCTHYCLFRLQTSKLWPMLATRDCPWTVLLKKERIKRETGSIAREVVAKAFSRATRGNIESFRTNFPDWFNKYDDTATLTIRASTSSGPFDVVTINASRDSCNQKLNVSNHGLVEGLLSVKHMYMAVAWAMQASYQVIQIEKFVESQVGLHFHKQAFNRFRLIADLRAFDAAQKITTVVCEPCLRSAQAFLSLLDGVEKNRGDEVYRGRHGDNRAPDWCLIWERFRKRLSDPVKFIESIDQYDVDQISPHESDYVRRALDSPCFLLPEWLTVAQTEGYILIDAVRRWVRSVLWRYDIKLVTDDLEERAERYKHFVKKIGTAMRLGVGQAL